MAHFENVVLLGAGGHAAVVAEAARMSGIEIAGYLSPSPSQDECSQWIGPYLGSDAAIPPLVGEGYHFMIGVGFVDARGAARRKQLMNSLPTVAMATIIHPTAVVAPSVELGAGCFAAAGSVISTRCVAGLGLIVNTGAVIDHDCRIGSNCHIAVGACVAGGVTIGDDVLVGAGAVILQGARIMDGVTIGAGAIVLGDIEAGATVVGAPARPISRENS